MRVCIEKLTGKLLESQQGDNTPLGVLTQNAINAGYTAEEVEEKYVTEEEYNIIRANQPIIPQPKTEIEMLKEEMATMQGALDFIIMFY